MGTLHCLDIQLVVLGLKFVDIRHFRRAHAIRDIHKSLFELVNYPKRCSGQILRTVQALYMVQRIYHEYKPIDLDNHRQLDILDQYSVQFVRSMIMDYPMVDFQGIYSWLYDCE